MTRTDRTVTLAEAMSMCDCIMDMSEQRLQSLPLLLLEETLETFRTKRACLESCLAKIGIAEARVMNLLRGAPS